jgi:cell division septation protein DedD
MQPRNPNHASRPHLPADFVKAIVFLLVLANLIFYAFSAGYLGQTVNPDAGRLTNQVAPESIRIVSRGEAPTAKATPPEPVPAATPDAAPASAEAPICLRWEALANADADRLESMLRDQFAGLTSSRQSEATEGSGWWVFIAAQASKADAEKKAAELRQLGVTDYFIIQDTGPNRYAISLGIFSGQKGANERLAELKAKGVRSARTAARPGKETSNRIEVRGPAGEKSRLLSLGNQLLPGNPAQDCP